MDLRVFVRCASVVLLLPAEHSCRNQALLRATERESVVAHLHPSFQPPCKARHHVRPSRVSMYALYASLVANNLRVSNRAKSTSHGYAASPLYLPQRPRSRSHCRGFVLTKRHFPLHPPRIDT